MKVSEMRNLIASMPDDADVMVIDKEDSCAHITGNIVSGRDGTRYIEVDNVFAAA